MSAIELKIPCHMKRQGNGYAVKYKGKNSWYFIPDIDLKGKYPHFFTVVFERSHIRSKVGAK